MPSPFPGMDPYLEGELWTTVHSSLIAEIARHLSPRLRPRYVALLEKRFEFAVPDVEDGVSVTAVGGGSLRPDVSVVARANGPASGATARAAAPLELATVMPVAIPHHSVEIRDVERRRLVTAIELLSPTNKRGRGREEYLARRDRLLLSRSHLIEIDLLREGDRVPMRQPLPSFPYFVFVSRAGERPLTGVWPIPLRQSLPIVPLPLLADDEDILMNLQEIFTSVYETAGYDLIVDYNRAPAPPLPVEDVEWARERLQSWS